MRIEIICNEGIRIDGHFVKIGDNIERVLEKYEVEDVIDDCYYFFDCNLKVEVKNNMIRHIDISRDADQIIVEMDGIKVFDVDKKDFLKYLEKKNGEKLDIDLGIVTAYNIGISVDEGISQNDMDALIEDAKKNSKSGKINKDIERDIDRFQHIEIIGVFKNG